jgi:hypothetical protein
VTHGGTVRCRRSKKLISTAASFFDPQITHHSNHRHPNRRCSIGRCSNRYCSNRRSNSTAEGEEHGSSRRHEPSNSPSQPDVNYQK